MQKRPIDSAQNRNLYRPQGQREPKAQKKAACATQKSRKRGLWGGKTWLVVPLMVFAVVGMALVGHALLAPAQSGPSLQAGLDTRPLSNLQLASSAQGAPGSLPLSSFPSSGSSGAPLPAGSAQETPLNIPPAGAFHFSVDDIISVFVDLHFKQNEYTSIFQQPTLAFLKRMHDEYGMVSTLYCFYESYDGSFDLSQCTTRYAEEFSQNAHWLRVGFHARKPEDFFSDSTVQQAAQDHADVTAALKQICGEAAIDPVLRLHWWDADEQQISAMAQQGLQGLLAGRRASDENYHLPPEEVETLFAQDFLPGPDGLFYTPTDLWLEDEKDLDAALAALAHENAPGRAAGLVVAFTHEYAMGDPAMHAKIEQCAQFALEKGMVFAFPEDVIRGRDS